MGKVRCQQQNHCPYKKSLWCTVVPGALPQGTLVCTFTEHDPGQEKTATPGCDGQPWLRKTQSLSRLRWLRYPKSLFSPSVYTMVWLGLYLKIIFSESVTGKVSSKCIGEDLFCLSLAVSKRTAQTQIPCSQGDIQATKIDAGRLLFPMWYKSH